MPANPASGNYTTNVTCKRCRRRLQGGSSRDAVRAPGGGYVHRGECKDWVTEEKPLKVKVAKKVVKPVKSSARAQGASRRKGYASKVCVRCGSQFTPTGGRQQQCLPCKELSLATPRECFNPRCAAVFTPRTGGQKYCTIPCQKRAVRLRSYHSNGRPLKPPPDYDPRVCERPGCDVVFKPRRSDQRFCCRNCSRHGKRRAEREKSDQPVTFPLVVP